MRFYLNYYLNNYIVTRKYSAVTGCSETCLFELMESADTFAEIVLLMFQKSFIIMSDKLTYFSTSLFLPTNSQSQMEMCVCVAL